MAYRTRGVWVPRVHIMAQNVGNDDTPDIYKLYGFWMGILFAIGEKHFFAFARDLQNPSSSIIRTIDHFMVHMMAHFVGIGHPNMLKVQP